MTLPVFLQRASVELGTSGDIYAFAQEYLDLQRLRPTVTPLEQFEEDWIACFCAWRRARAAQDARKRHDA